MSEEHSLYLIMAPGYRGSLDMPGRGSAVLPRGEKKNLSLRWLWCTGGRKATSGVGDGAAAPEPQRGREVGEWPCSFCSLALSRFFSWFVSSSLGNCLQTFRPFYRKRQCMAVGNPFITEQGFGWWGIG